jgi:glucokinase
MVVKPSQVTGFTEAEVIEAPVVAVVEVGGSHVTAALVSAAGNPPAIRNLVTASLDPAASADVLLDVLVSCARELDAPGGARWGVAVPGPFDYGAGVAWYRGVAKFDALYGVDVGRALREGLGVAVAADMVFMGDAEAFAVGEWVFGAGRSLRRILGVTLGTGVGSSFLDGGVAVVDGPTVPPAGRADLLKVDDRPLEESMSARAIVARYARAGGQPSSVAAIAELARGGDDRAGAVLDEAFAILGAALAPWVASFGAQVVVVGGAMVRSWDLIAPSLRRGMNVGSNGGTAERVARDQSFLVPATHADHAALFGAAYRASGRGP